MNWESIRCRYFSRVCREELSAELSTHGLDEESETWEGGIVYRAVRIFVEISYDLESSPRYRCTVVIGFGANTDENARRRQAIPLWYAIPISRPEYNYPPWRFMNEDDLRAVLRRLSDELFEGFVYPLVLDESALEQLVTKFRADNGLPK